MALWSKVPRKGVEIVRVGDVSVRLHRPQQPTGAAVLWIHGGGYVGGAPVQDDSLCRAIARATGAIVAAPAYRLAPDHPFPAGLDDCHAVLGWLIQQPQVDSHRVAVAGASAGGGLAAALALKCRDLGDPPLALQLLVYPMLDDRTGHREQLNEMDTRLWSNASNRIGWAAYAGPDAGSGSIPPLAAPARSTDLTGLAPAWIGVGTADLFHDENVDYAQRLRQAGVPCQLHIVPGAFHGFDVLSRRPVGRDFRTAQLAALSTALDRK